MVIWSDKSGEEPSEQVPMGREGTMILGDHCFPGGLGDMPDSQGPNMAEKPIGTGVSGALLPARRLFPVAQILGREIFNGCIYHICSLGIFLPQVIPPHMWARSDLG